MYYIGGLLDEQSGNKYITKETGVYNQYGGWQYYAADCSVSWTSDS